MDAMKCEPSPFWTEEGSGKVLSHPTHGRSGPQVLLWWQWLGAMWTPPPHLPQYSCVGGTFYVDQQNRFAGLAREFSLPQYVKARLDLGGSFSVAGDTVDETLLLGPSQPMEWNHPLPCCSLSRAGFPGWPRLSRSLSPSSPLLCSCFRPPLTYVCGEVIDPCCSSEQPWSGFHCAPLPSYL